MRLSPRALKIKAARFGFMGDLKDHRLIFLKGWLFLLMGMVAAAGLLLEHPEWRTAALLGIALWSFCRFYYFAFYVIEKYVDPSYKFSSLYAFLVSMWRRRRAGKPGA